MTATLTLRRRHGAASIAVAGLAASLLVAACGSTSPPASSESGSPSPAVAPAATTVATPVTAPATPTSFTSTIYRYTLAVPAGWSAAAATAPWKDGSDASHDVPEADQWMSPGSASAWAMAAPFGQGLASYTKRLIADTKRYHSDTCPEQPASRDRITIGGHPGTLVAYDCGILINLGVTVHHGVGYLFGFRDPGVHAASDPADRATFLALLESVRLPD